MKVTSPINKVKPGGFVLIDDAPCRIDKVSRSSSGKHGAAKIRVDAIGILDGRRRNVVKPSSGNVDVPIINKHTAQVLAIVGDNAQLMDMKNYEVFELPIPEELKGKLQEGSDIQYFEVVGTKTLKQIK